MTAWNIPGTRQLRVRTVRLLRNAFCALAIACPVSETCLHAFHCPQWSSWACLSSATLFLACYVHFGFRYSKEQWREKAVTKDGWPLQIVMKDK